MSKPTTPLPPPSSLAPYYEVPGVTVYNARCEDVLAAGLVPIAEVALIHGDAPYGVNEQTKRAQKRRVGAAGLHGGGLKCRDWEPIEGDASPYDPAFLLALKRPTVLWGANHFAPRVPESPSWILWDKREDTTPDDNADGELAWSNLGGPLRIFRHLWRGVCRASEHGAPLGPTQKPIALSLFVFSRAKLKRGDLVFVPYLGSGPDLPAAKALGLRVIACETSAKYCRTAVARLGAAPHPEPTERLGPLFAARI